MTGDELLWRLGKFFCGRFYAVWWGVETTAYIRKHVTILDDQIAALETRLKEFRFGGWPG